MTKIFLQTLQANVRLIIGLVLSIAASIGVNVAPPLILQYIVDSLASGHFTIMPLLTAGIIFFAVNAGSGLVDAVKETLITIFGQKITLSLFSELDQVIWISHDGTTMTADHSSLYETHEEYQRLYKMQQAQRGDRHD